MNNDNKPKTRKPNRWQGYDYTLENHYFITICTKDKQCFFGEVKNEQMQTNTFGQIAEEEIKNLMIRFTHIEIEIYQIMPNHIHAIISILRQVPKEGLSEIVRAYKSIVANRILDFYKKQNIYMGKLWQYSFHDHIIRSPQSYKNIANYIIENPLKWKSDDMYSE